MEKINIQVMLKDGSLSSFDITITGKSELFTIEQQGTICARFKPNTDGSWTLLENPAEISDDLRRRIENQLNGLLG